MSTLPIPNPSESDSTHVETPHPATPSSPEVDILTLTEEKPVSDQTHKEEMASPPNMMYPEATIAAAGSGFHPASERSRCQPLQLIAGRYNVLRPHAKGGMGFISVALDAELDREVAFKEMQHQFTRLPDQVNRFIFEAEVTGRLEHPGIVPVYGLGQFADGRPFYAMRFIEGETFSAAIKRFHEADGPNRDYHERTLALHNLLKRFVDVCYTIAFAHSRGYLHCDIKPVNVMLGSFGETLVVDWGLAKKIDETKNYNESSIRDETAPVDQTQMGTPPYMSPEQAASQWDLVGPASDIYSLGATLYEILVGKPPFSGTLVEVLKKIGKGDYLPPRKVKPEVDAALDAIVRKAMAIRRRERYQTVQQLAEDVERWLADEPVSVYTETRLQRLYRWSRHHQTLVASLAALILGSVIMLGVGLIVVTKERDAKEQARQAESKAREIAEKAEQVANQQRQLALKTLRSVVDDIQDQLKNRPDLQDLRKKLLQKAQEGLKEVARSAETANRVDHQQLCVYLELGDIFLTVAEGGTQEAMNLYTSAHKLAKQLVETNSNPVNAKRDLAICLSKLGDVQMQMGHTAEALEHYRASLEFDQSLVTQVPENDSLKHNLAISYERLGGVYQRLENDGEARKAYQQFNQIIETLAASHPDNRAMQHDWAVSVSKLGDLELQVGEFKTALQRYQDYQRIAQKLSDTDPNDLIARRDLSIAFGKVGDVYLNLNQNRQALEQYEKCLQIDQQLAEELKTTQARRDLSVTYSKLAEVHQQVWQPKQALAYLEKALLIDQQLADADLKNAQAQRDLAITLYNLAEVHSELEQKEEALAAYEKYHKLCFRLAAIDPKDRSATWNLMQADFKLASILRDLGRFAQASEFFQRSLEVAQRLAQDAKSNDTDELASHIRLVQPRLEFCKAAVAVMNDPNRIRQQPEHLRTNVLTQILTPLAEEKKTDSLLKAADLLLELGEEEIALFDAARAYALAVKFVSEPSQQQAHTKRAVQLLQQAITKGFQDRKRIQHHPDFQAIQNHADFQALFSKKD